MDAPYARREDIVPADQPPWRRRSGAAAVGLLALAAITLQAGCPDDAPLEIEVLDNEHNPLSCLVRWTTDRPSTSAVEVRGEGRSLLVEDDAEVTDHQVTVIGLHASEEVILIARSTDGDGGERTSDEVAYGAGVLPLDLVTELTVVDEELFGGGWTLFNVSIGVGDHPPTAVMVDGEGRPVWVHQHGSTRGEADVQVTLVDGGRVLFGGDLARGTPAVEVDLAGEVRWEGPLQPGTEALVPDGGMHHWFDRRPDGTYVALFYEVDGDQVDDEIRQLGPDGETLWSWRARPVIGGEDEPYAWGNAAHVDPERQVAYYSARDRSELMQIDMASGDVLWTFGEGGDFQADPDAAWPWPTGAHAPEPMGGDRWLLYDNGDAERGFSRVVEYTIDEEAMRATLEWEYPGQAADDPWYTFAMGDADRLDDGNTLICAGNLSASADTSRVFEVTPDGTTAWSLTLRTSDPDRAAAAYMAQRIPALVTGLE